MSIPSSQRPSDAAWTKKPEALVNRRLSAFILHDLERENRLEKVRNSSPKFLSSSSAPSGANALGSSKEKPTTPGDLGHTAPTVRKARSKGKKLPVTQPLGIDGKTLRDAIDRAIRTYLAREMRAGSAVNDLFESFCDMVDLCLAGQQHFSARDYSIYTSAVETLSPYLTSDEEAILEKLEKSSFIQ